MNNWKIGTRITAGFAAVIAIAMALGIFAYSQVGNINKSATDVADNSLPSVYVMGQIHSNTEQLMRLVLQHAIANDQDEMANLDAEIRDVRAKNGELTLFCFYFLGSEDEAEFKKFVAEVSA